MRSSCSTGSSSSAVMRLRSTISAACNFLGGGHTRPIISVRRVSRAMRVLRVLQRSLILIGINRFSDACKATLERMRERHQASRKENYATNNKITRAACATLTLAGFSFGDIVVPSGTKVACRLEQTISSATADEGQQVQLAVTENVKVNDQIVIPQGSACVGTIVLATAKRSMGRSGKLDFSIDKVRIGDGDNVPLRYTMQKKSGKARDSARA